MAYQPWTTDKREGEKASQSHEDNVNHIDDVMSGLKKDSGKENYTISNQTVENEPYGCGDGGCECEMDEVEATSGRLSVISIAEQVSFLTELRSRGRNLTMTASRQPRARDSRHGNRARRGVKRSNEKQDLSQPRFWD